MHITNHRNGALQKQLPEADTCLTWHCDDSLRHRSAKVRLCSSKFTSIKALGNNSAIDDIPARCAIEVACAPAVSFIFARMKPLIWLGEYLFPPACAEAPIRHITRPENLLVMLSNTRRHMRNSPQPKRLRCQL
jgi:hypothetical protein